MFFTRLVRIVATIGLVLGLLRTAIGLGIATEFFSTYEAALARYGGSAASSGEMIDEGLYWALVSIVLGVLGEISVSVRR